MRPDVGDLEIFLDLNHTLSFSITSERLRLDRTIVSRRIQRLENALGVKLFERTTRKVRVTSEGRTLLMHANGVMGGLDSIQELFSKPEAPKGTIRISAPVTVSHSILSRVLPMVREKYPGITIELIATDRVLDFVEEGLDLTIRATAPEDSSFIGRPLVKNELIFAASPKYIKKMGMPRRVSDLGNHSLLYIDFHQEIAFKKAKTKLKQFEQNRSVICSDGRVLVRLAEEGAGICIRPRWDIESSTASGQLVEIELNDSLDDKTVLYLMYPKSNLLPHRTRVVIDMLLASYFRPQ